MVRNSGWNLAGLAVPLLTALVAIPILIHRMGDSRFGFLSIAWMLIGYFGLLDLGIGRAITHGVAKRLSHDTGADVTELVWSGLAVLLGMGVVVAAIVAGVASPLVRSFLKIPEALKPEAARALAIVALTIPFVLLSAGLRGLLEAKQAFREVNLLMMPMGALLFLGPVAVSQVTVALPAIIAALWAVRGATTILLFRQCIRTVPGFLTVRVRRAAMRELLSFGGWMTVSNIVSPVMQSMDRLVVGGLLSVSEVTYYVTPFELVTKLLVAPGSVANASFPEFSRLSHSGDAGAARRYFLHTLGLVAAVLLPLVLVAFVGANVILSLWISPAVADRSATVMRILAVGIACNGLAYVPFAYVQGLGRSDVTAGFHVVELAVYLPLLYVLIRALGLPGVALAWVVRAALDAGLLFAYAASRLRDR